MVDISAKLLRVAVVGGTGFVGSYIVRALNARGHDVSLLVREGSEEKLRGFGKTHPVVGDLDSADALRQLLQSSDAVIYLVGILRANPGKGVTFEKTQLDGVRRVADLALEYGTRRFLLMSANGVEAADTAYQRTKLAAEEYVMNADLDATVLRPSVIFGDPQGRMEFATQLYRDMVRLPVPAIGFRSGWSPFGDKVRMAPVHVHDVADAFIAALEDDATIGETFELCGPDILTWDEMIERVAHSVGKSKAILPMPIAVMNVAATLLDRLPAFPVTRDQLTMLGQNNICTNSRLRELIGRAPASFDFDNLGYLRE